MSHRRTIGAVLLVWALAAAPPPAPAQIATPPPSGPLHRLLATPDWLSLRLEHRSRFEHLQNDFRSGSAGKDETAAVLRTLLAAELHIQRLSAGVEIEDSRAYADDQTPLNTTAVDALEVLQAYLGWRQANAFRAGDQLALTAGRMTIDLGSRRLVARNEFRNTINAFTGLDLQWTSPGRHVIRGFATMPVVRLPTDPERLEDNEIELDQENDRTALWGLFYASPALYADARLEAYVVGIMEGDRHDAPSANRRLATPGFRILRPPATGRLDFQLESMLQAGESRASTAAKDTRDLDHLAFSIHASTGYRFDAPWTPRLVLQYDVASGDSSPNDRDNNRFDPLFGARRFELGPTSLYGALARSNLNSPGLRLEVAPRSDVDAFVAYRPTWLEADRDAWTTAGLRDPAGNSGAFLGHQIEGRVRWHVRPSRLVLDLGCAYLAKGEFSKDAPGAVDASPLYFYTQLTVTL
ncbi:MAG: alginate export family protein [Deltaproteobacteria bacterium]|nr:alginate export family protein [Deltaproteobacteria bacterium]